MTQKELFDVIEKEIDRVMKNALSAEEQAQKAGGDLSKLYFLAYTNAVSSAVAASVNVMLQAGALQVEPDKD